MPELIEPYSHRISDPSRNHARPAVVSMSASPEETGDAAREEDVVEEEMTDMVDLPAGRTYSSDDDDPSAERGHEEEDHHVADLLEQERRQSIEQPPEDLGVVNRYKELAHEQADSASDTGSAALPRRAGSPVGSTLSLPDDSPSVQVGSRHFAKHKILNLTFPGIHPILSE